MSVEVYFSTLEGKTSKIIDTIVEAALKGLEHRLDAEKKDIWVRYLCHQRRRTPDVIRPAIENYANTLNDEIPEAWEEYVERPCTPDENAMLKDPVHLKRIEKNSFSIFAGIEPSKEILAKLQNMSIIVAAIHNPNKNFVCGSRPIDRFDDWFAVHSKVAIKLAHPRDYDQLIILDNSFDVRQINLDTVSRSTFFAGPSHKLIESLARPR